jgi:hypothetical protein
MVSRRQARSPQWYGIPVRVAVLTFIGTLICFALSLFFAIVGTVIAAWLHGGHADMRFAYLHIALPAALVGGSVVFVLALVTEIRHYRQRKTLSTIERISE